MNAEPVTKTRTLNGALREAIARLEQGPQTTRVKQVLVEAQEWRLVLQSWVDEPPSPEEQSETIPKVMQLLKETLSLPDEEPVPSSDSTPQPEIELELDIDVDVERPPKQRKFTTTKPLARIPVKKTDRAGRRSAIPPEPDVLQAASGVLVLRPGLAPWRQVPGLSGIAVKLLENRMPGTAQALVRLDPGTALPAHLHHTPEDLYVLSGMLRIGDIRVNAGELIRSEPGAVSDVLESPGECLLLVVGSDRDELLAVGRPSQPI